MTRRDYFFQFAAALVVFLVFSFFIKVPGYMDSEYYTLSATQIVTGKGLTQPILWNYLDDPTGIPHPSHTYWMPASSIVASIGMFISNRADFASARIPFVLFAALSAPAAGWMGFRFSRRKFVSWLAACLAIFCGYYAPYTSTVDSFFLIMVGAWVIFLIFDRLKESGNQNIMILWLYLGLASGWMHLNRADGILWLALVLAIWLVFLFRKGFIKQKSQIYFSLLSIITGYFLVTGFWYFRNVVEYSNLFPPHSSRALWMTSYNDLFAYPPEELSFNRWIASGYSNIFNDRLNAFFRNLTILAAVQGMILFVPLWIIAAWKRRNDSLIRVALVMEAIILIIMSFVFPYSGMRGGFLHSSAALQPFFWGLAAAGAADVIQWAAIRRKWNLVDSEKVLLPGIVIICCIVTIFVFRLIVVGNIPGLISWEESFRSARTSMDLLKSNNIDSATRVLINDPAGFALASGGEALVIPDGPIESTLAVAKKFDVNFLILEKNHVFGLDELYKNPEKFKPFSLLSKAGDAYLFKINLSGNGG